MPELPEVETSRLYVEEFCVGSTITKVHATEQGGGPVRRRQFGTKNATDPNMPT